ncbi:discoidin domain-containing protein [Asticcacaulis sp. AC402]|uniref:discoidin domain-containing protein n=1 Tax=Asticcacaulis sp. AC402 TaxID=1282361 RepID=UPI0003C3BD01|nr:discoidin domain-containing protein [Asticcacaulis sp. AC402]ESQ76707.1 hypothetical protein ABAC402_03260 [Asticcacaulis sp. AC402]
MTSPSSSSAQSLVNLAPGKTASQSSLSHWSGSLGAAGALVKDDERTFGFHTSEEDSPWWQVDLHAVYPIDTINLYNRRDILFERARTVSVAVSLDGNDWQAVHAGMVYFGYGPDKSPLSLPLGGQVKARYIRLQLHERVPFHLWYVEVLIQNSVERIVKIRGDLGFGFPVKDIDPDSGGSAGYELVAATPEDLDGTLIGLDINNSGAFGNSVIQYATAIEVAHHLGLKYVRASPGKLIRLSAPIRVGQVDVLPSDTSLPGGGAFLRGNFFFRNHFKTALTKSTSQSYYELVRNHVSKLYTGIDITQIPSRPKDELAIHIRSGDIFSTWIHAGYIQPPLAFYELVIDRLVREKGIKRIRLVYEDKGNPVIDVLEARLKAAAIPFSSQSSTVEDDIMALIDSQHLAFGIGTFGTGVCHFSRQIETVYYFSPTGGCPFAGIPNVRHVVHITDKAGAYIKEGQWANSPEQRQMMIDYPIENLAVSGEWTHPVVSDLGS